VQINKVAVVGAGTMGAGIAQVAAQEGFEAILLDISEPIVRQGIERIDKNLSRSVEKGRLTSAGKDQVLQRVHAATQMEEVGDAGLVVEAIFEDPTAKSDIFRRLDSICPPETIFATNTSTLSVTRLAGAVSRPDRFLGLHFFNPVPVMRLVEVIPGLRTSEQTVRLAIDLTRAIKKAPVRAADCPGFLVNRILMPYAGEAMLAAQEGAATPTEIDEALKKAGFPMGPLAVNDMVGIDVGLHTFPILCEGYGERFPFPLLFERLCKAGRLGAKSGKGIYADGKVDQEFLGIIRQIQEETGISHTQFSHERLILRQVNEAVYCLQERIATAEDIDRAMVLGTGFPADQNGVGGPLHWADEMGLDLVLEKLEHYNKTLGQRFLPHFLLKQYVAAGYLGRKAKRGFFEYPDPT